MHEFGLELSARGVQNDCNKQAIHKVQNVCSLWPHIFLKTFKIIPWRIWAWVHFKPWFCLRGGQHKDVCQNAMSVNFMIPFPTSFFYLFASSIKISQYDSPIHTFRKKNVNQNESHYLDMSLYPPKSHLLFPQNMILDSWYSLLIRSPISMI